MVEASGCRTPADWIADQSAASLDVGGMVIIAIQATQRQIPTIKTTWCVKTPQPTKPRHPFRGTKLVDDQEEAGCTYLDAAGLELGARRWTSQGMRGHSIRASTAQISERLRALAWRLRSQGAETWPRCGANCKVLQAGGYTTRGMASEPHVRRGLPGPVPKQGGISPKSEVQRFGVRAQAPAGAIGCWRGASSHWRCEKQVLA